MLPKNANLYKDNINKIQFYTLYTPTTLANIQNLEKKTKIALTYFPYVKPAKCLNTGVRCNAVRF